MMTMRTLTIALLSAALVLPACRKKEDYSQESPPQTSTTTTPVQSTADRSTTANSPTTPQTDMPGNKIGAAATPEQQIDLVEYAIHVPATLPPGPTTFRVTNAGKENHSLIIEGNGTTAALQSPLTRGDTATLAIELKPGTYTAHCPVDGHSGKGMTATITVK